MYEKYIKYIETTMYLHTPFEAFCKDYEAAKKTYELALQKEEERRKEIGFGYYIPKPIILDCE